MYSQKRKVGKCFFQPAKMAVFGTFHGHVVLQVEGTLVDPSLQQAERLEHGIVLGRFLYCEPGHDFSIGLIGQNFGFRVMAAWLSTSGSSVIVTSRAATGAKREPRSHK
jgi:hypothetical protein